MSDVFEKLAQADFKAYRNSLPDGHSLSPDEIWKGFIAERQEYAAEIRELQIDQLLDRPSTQSMIDYARSYVLEHQGGERGEEAGKRMDDFDKKYFGYIGSEFGNFLTYVNTIKDMAADGVVIDEITSEMVAKQVLRTENVIKEDSDPEVIDTEVRRFLNPNADVKKIWHHTVSAVDQSHGIPNIALVTFFDNYLDPARDSILGDFASDINIGHFNFHASKFIEYLQGLEQATVREDFDSDDHMRKAMEQILDNHGLNYMLDENLLQYAGAIEA